MPAPKPFEAIYDYIEPEPNSGCWIWTAGRSDAGYGRFSRAGIGRGLLVHKVLYERNHGPVPPGMEIDHKCRVRACVNPAHLRAVTHKKNMENSTYALRTHCPAGHPLSGDNLAPRVINRGRFRWYRRSCATCNRQRYWRVKPLPLPTPTLRALFDGLQAKYGTTSDVVALERMALDLVEKGDEMGRRRS